MYEKTLLIFSLIVISYFIFVTPNDAYSQTYSDKKSVIISIPKYNKTNYYLDINSEDDPTEILRLFVNDTLFDVNPTYDYNGQVTSLTIEKKRELEDLYNKIIFSNKSHDTVFIYPSFTQAAYDTSGFYDYYKRKCNSSCLTVNIPDKIFGGASSSSFGAAVLHLLNFSYVKDEDIDKNPDILKQYKRVIVLHNEYVTKKEFNAITSHPDVIFLYPNSLYAEVKSNYASNTITLINGHGYPYKYIKNGFDWKYDNSRYEYDRNCEDWNFYKKGNYTMLNCYPEYEILFDVHLLEALQDADPTNMKSNISNWLMHNDPDTTKTLLHSFDAEGNHLPTWIQRSALMFLKGEISKDEFLNMMEYLNTILHNRQV